MRGLFSQTTSSYMYYTMKPRLLFLIYPELLLSSTVLPRTLFYNRDHNEF